MCPTITIFGETIILYNIIGIIAAACFALFFYLQLPTKKNMLTPLSEKLIKKHSGETGLLASRSFYAVIETTLLLVIAEGLSTAFNILWAGLTSGSNANFFGNIFFYPVFFMLICWLFKLNPLKHMDLYAPATLCNLIISKISCFMTGCCYGYESQQQIFFNLHTKRYEIPIQLIECLVAVAILIFVMNYRKKNTTPGTVFPVITLAYSITRFFTEFMRGDYEPVFWFIKNYQIQCIIATVLGLIGLYLLKRRPGFENKILTKIEAMETAQR